MDIAFIRTITPSIQVNILAGFLNFMGLTGGECLPSHQISTP